jgi:hypothetical protein
MSSPQEFSEYLLSCSNNEKISPQEYINHHTDWLRIISKMNITPDKYKQLLINRPPMPRPTLTRY